jgi:hypothetical protein
MAKSTNPFRWFDSSPEVIHLVVLMDVDVTPISHPAITRVLG